MRAKVYAYNVLDLNKHVSDGHTWYSLRCLLKSEFRKITIRKAKYLECKTRKVEKQ